MVAIAAEDVLDIEDLERNTGSCYNDRQQMVQLRLAVLIGTVLLGLLGSVLFGGD